MAVWDMISDERASLVEGLVGLPDNRWTKPSLCPGWTTTDVVGHVLATTYVTPPKFFAGLLASGFSFQHLPGEAAAPEDQRQVPPRASSTSSELRYLPASHLPDPTVAMLRRTDRARRGHLPGCGWLPGAPRRAPGGSGGFLHEEQHDREQKRIEGDPAGHRRRLDPRLGAEGKRPLIALVMAMTGRSAALDDLSGEGRRSSAPAGLTRPRPRRRAAR